MEDIMTEIYSSENPLYSWILKSVLESNGIDCEVEETSLRQALGDIPVNQTWTKLFINKESDIQIAKEIIEKYEPKLNDVPSFCPNCDSDKVELFKAGNYKEFDTFKCKECGYTWKKGQHYKRK